MRASPILWSLLSGAGVLLLSAVAHAQVADFSAGVKGFAGGNLYNTPSNVPGGYDGVGYPSSAGGFGWGAGVYGELQLIKFLGLELGLTYDTSDLYRDVTYSSVVKVREKVTTKSLRIPILAKGIVPVPFGRLSLFVGPELVKPQSSSGEIEVKEGKQYLANPGELDNAIAADTQDSTMLTMGMGATVELPASLELPIELRFSKNLSQPEDWTDRVKIGPPPTGLPYTVNGQNSWDFRLGVGVGYRF